MTLSTMNAPVSGRVSSCVFRSALMCLSVKLSFNGCCFGLILRDQFKQCSNPYFNVKYEECVCSVTSVS